MLCPMICANVYYSFSSATPHRDFNAEITNTCDLLSPTKVQQKFEITMKLKQPICKKQEKIGCIASGKTKKACKKKTAKRAKKRSSTKRAERTLF